MLRICVAGATGWVGRAVAEAIPQTPDLRLAVGVARRSAGSDLGLALGRGEIGVPVMGTVDEALRGVAVDVVIDYTSHLAVKQNALVALGHGVPVVIGSSGLSAAEFDEIDAVARTSGVGVIASGNFSITAAMAQAAALLVAAHLPNVEIIDYAYAEKLDAPSGTSRELAERIVTRWETDRTTQPEMAPADSAIDVPSTRGARVAGIPIHSVRLPSYSVSTEVVFGLPDERLTIRHDAGQSAAPYVGGTLLAARMVVGRVGLTRGLDALLFEGVSDRAR